MVFNEAFTSAVATCEFFTVAETLVLCGVDLLGSHRVRSSSLGSLGNPLPGHRCLLVPGLHKFAEFVVRKTAKPEDLFQVAKRLEHLAMSRVLIPFDALRGRGKGFHCSPCMYMEGRANSGRGRAHVPARESKVSRLMVTARPCAAT